MDDPPLATTPPGAVGIVAGHMIDAAGRPEPRFPPEAVAGVGERVRAWLTAERLGLSFSSAASGTDLIFLGLAREVGISTHVMLPFAADKFLETSVRPAGEEWVRRFYLAIAAAASVTILQGDVPDDATSAYELTNRTIVAEAVRRAGALGTNVSALGVWNGQAGDGRGGTADAVAAWRRAKLKVQVIHPMLPG